MRLLKNGKFLDKEEILALGLESSCDETAVALVSSAKNIVSNLLISHADRFMESGGVIPEVAARAHLDHFPELVRQAIQDSGKSLSEIDMIAYTAGPGLLGGLVTSVVFGKVLSSVLKIPAVAVNHLEGHILSVRLERHLAFPFLAVLLTGGHSQIVLVDGVGSYQEFAKSQDDALGEAFDKVARMLGLGYPGGPAIEEKARLGCADRFDFPRPVCSGNRYDFSFSGLKTAVSKTLQSLGALDEQVICDVCASFQACIVDVIVDRLKKVLPRTGVENIVLVGGVAANQHLYQAVARSFRGYSVYTPRKELCTDNAAMIAWAGIERFRRSYFSGAGQAPDPNLALGRVV